MSDYLTLLITLLMAETNTLAKVAVRFKREKLPLDICEYPLEYRLLLERRLPLHVRTIGPIVAVEVIFDSVELLNK